MALVNVQTVNTDERSPMRESVFETMLVGNQPKIEGDVGRAPNLRLARNRLDKAAITPDEYEATLRATIKRTIEDQVTAGLDRVTDGRIRWDDPVTPFACAHDGFTIGGLIRFFDNNVYYRRPTIDGPIRFVRSAVIDDFRLAKTLTDRPVMPSLCGPFSLAKFGVDKSYNGSRALFEDCARLIRGELETLAQAGADWVQLDEPFLVACPDEMGLAVDTISAAVRRSGLKTLVYTYFGSLGPIADRLWDLPCDAVGADCATAPGNIEILAHGPKAFGRAFGLYDARSTRMERPDAIAKTLERIAVAGAGDWPKCWITPSAALEFLPYKNAVAKMRRLTEDVRQFQGTPVDQTV